MSLGDLFSDEFKAKHYQNIDLGSAILIEIPDFDITHKKFAIYFANNQNKEGFCGLVIINSVINANVNRNAYLKSQHVLIDQKRHTFLEYDSFVDCTQIHEFKLQIIIDCLVKDHTRLKGNVSADVLYEVHQKLVNSDLISNKIKRSYSLI